MTAGIIDVRRVFESCSFGIRTVFSVCAYMLCLLGVFCLCACNPSVTPVTSPDEEKTQSEQHPVPLPAKSPKRGVSFNFAFPEDVFLMKDFVSWSYNWGPAEDDGVAQYMDMTDIAFIPMAWTANFSAEQITAWIDAHPSTKYILGFNEPNLTDQCNMTPRQVADAWPRLKNLADSLGVALVSPAMNYGTLAGYSDPIKWLDEFFTYIPLAESGIKVIAIHCYMNNAAAVKGYVERFYKYELPIWMTEFCAWDGGVAGETGQMDYMADVITYMELNPRIERYAWFMPRTDRRVDEMPYNQLLTHGMPSELTQLGLLFEALPNMSQPKLHDASEPMNPILFASCAQADYLQADGLCSAPHFRLSDDTEPNMPVWMMYNFLQGQWVEYAMQAKENKSALQVRYQSTGEPVIALQVDGGKSYLIVLPYSADWTTQQVSYPLSEGKHTIRLTMQQGFCNLSTIYWK